MDFTFSIVGTAWAAEEGTVSTDTHAQTGAQTGTQTGTDGAAVSGETHTETGVAHEGGHEGGFPPFNSEYFPSQLLWLAITFGLFYWFMNKVAIPRIAGILEVRRDRISGDLDEAQRMRDEADAAHAAYEQELAEARSRAHAIAQEANEKARAEADAERKKVEAELGTRIQEAENRIAEIRAKAMSEVGGIASDTATAIVKELIGGTTTKAEITKAVDAVAVEEQGR